MDQTPEQLDWIKQNADKLRQRGYDPERVELDPDGNIVEVPRRSVLGTLARQGVKSILPTGASFAGGAAGAGMGSFAGPVGTIVGGLAGGLLGGGAAGFAQEKALDAIAPEFQKAAREGAEQNPKTAWLGDAAATLATMRPNFRVLANASVLGKSALQSPAMKEAALNAAINAGGAAAGQGVNMLQGGDFEPGRFLADSALGAVLTDPNRLGQKFGLKPSSHETPKVPVADLNSAKTAIERGWEIRNVGEVEPKAPVDSTTSPTEAKGYTKWWKKSTTPTDKMFDEAIKESKLTIPPERLEELRKMPEAIAALESPEKFRDFVWSSSEEALQEAYAYKKKQGELLTAEEVPAAEKFRDTKLAGEMARGREDAVRARENQNWLDAENARFEAEQAREELESRMSRTGAEGEKPLSQAELATMTQVAAKRGLEITFEDLGNNRGQYVLSTKEGQPLLKVNPLTATMDTIAHEVGHDVFNRSASKGMKESLIETAMGSDAYKAELEARLKQGASPEQAHAIAAEEGIVDAFARAGNKSDASDVRAWFKAFKASVKHMAGMKLAPEDAIAWMHYATHNDTPWSGLRNRAGEGVRNQEGEDIGYHAGDLGYAKDTTIGRVGGRSTGNLGTGVYFTSSPEKLGGPRSDRPVQTVDFSKFNLFKPKDATTAELLNDGLKRLNNLVDRYADAIKSPEDFNAPKAQTIATSIADSLAKATGKPVTPEMIGKIAEQAAPDYLKHFTKSEYVDSASTRLMKALGYEGIDVRHIPDFDNTYHGSVIYNKSLKSTPFDPSVRNQGPSLGALDPEQKKLSRVNPVVGDAFTAAFNTRDRKMGELSSKLEKVAALSETQKRELLKHLENESDTQTLVAPPAALAEAYAQMRNEFIPEVPRMFNDAGFGIRTAKGFRAHGENPTYVPLHHISPDVRETLTTKQGSPEYAGLKKDFIDWTRDYLIKGGMDKAAASAEAMSRFEKEITEYNRKPDASETLGFAGVRKPEGATLPPSWRSDDLMGNLSNYIKRSATDFASQTHLESSPEVMAALGAKKFGQDREIPLDVLENTPNIISHPNLQNVLRDYHGRMADNSTLADVGRVVSPLALGPISRSVDVMTTGLKGLAYLRPSEYVDGAINFSKNLFDWSALMSRSHQSGLNRLDTGANMRHVMGVGDANVNFMTRFASGLNKFTGLDKLESGARAIAQAWGETIVAMKRQQALAGDAKSVEFLDTLSKDWRSRDDLDLAAQVGRLLQGSYDTRQLPSWMLDGGLAPFLTWSKWSAGQLQAFNDFAVAPLLKGDAKPLIGQLLIGVLGGSVVQQVQEWMNNRQTRDVNWKELEAWAEQNKGELGAPGNTLLASKLLTLSQRMGTFGFAGDLVKGVVEAAAGQSPQGVLHNPAIEGIFNTSKYGAAAIAAISSGEDVGAVLGKLTKDLAVNNSQVVRATRNWVDTDENLAYNDRRRQNLFNFLSGQGAGNNTFAVSYKDLAEKEFDKTKEPADMIAQAGKLLEKAAENATSQEDLVARLRKLGTSQNGIMPNPRRQPDKAFKYLKWVHDAEGADESTDIQRRWQEEDARAKYRKSLVSPGSAGAR